MADNQTPAVEEAAAAVAKLYLDEVTGEQVSKTELKKRTKQRERESEKAKKAEAAAAANPAAAAKPKSTEASEKELTPNQVRRVIYTLLRFLLTVDYSTLRFARVLSMLSTSRARPTPTR